MIKYEFHVSKAARDKYKFDTSLFTITGDLIIVNFGQARLLTEKINSKRKKDNAGLPFVTAGQLNGLGLMHEIFHYIISLYENQFNPGVMKRNLQFFKHQMGSKKLNNVLLKFVKEFPPVYVYNGKLSVEDYINGFTGNKSNKEIIIEEIILLNIENNNPATASLEELYSDKKIAEESNYLNLIKSSENFFKNEKLFGKENLSLIQFLRTPINNNPYNLEGQLEYIRKRWRVYVYEKFNDRLLLGEDLINEDIKLFLQHGGGEKATPPVPFYNFDEDYFRRLKAKFEAGEKLSNEEIAFYHSEIERFTEDIDWMPKVVMIAKNSYVWLEQLSKKYNRKISALDQIPDEELDCLAGWNFTALWLIGIWERSSASIKIKQMTGNPEAIASAYSMYDYVIASDLGGEEAFQNLKERAWERGIRLASDMVPNHTGIYSKWVIEKPDYFIQVETPPYPSYTFLSPNLSDNPRVEIRIEDKYYDRTDASVVFERRDVFTGERRYIYHGNDGTNMPWNDTAQLNLLKPEVRESLIQTILQVARKFPIIRFDAAMTLAKKHYQRLWFPQPGTGGAIPSRSDFAMSASVFDAAMPDEFWREVVDRINSELPNTLLLAEAFWLMEGYFVRTLGMHRVYNSAFMHMLMKEENSKYRELIKNTLDFNPEILKRYVNFMSNPDEETAVNQFGKGDKYFGVALLMVTLPGLPMFAHGQIEGFSEKYGMEYKKAYYNEFIDENLVRRHEYEIFPLMKKRYLFSQVNNFNLYDFIDSYGNINDNVFAFTNKSGDEKVLVIYNNSYYECSGSISNSCVKVVSNGETKEKITTKIADALGIKSKYNYYYLYREHKSNLEYLLSGSDISENGLFFSMQGYQFKVCFGFYEIHDITGKYQQLYNLLRGQGVPSIGDVLKELVLLTLHRAIKDLFSVDSFKHLKSYCFGILNTPLKENSLQNAKPVVPFNFENNLNIIIDEINRLANLTLDKSKIRQHVINEMKKLAMCSGIINKQQDSKTQLKWFQNALKDLLIYNNNGSTFFKEIFFIELILSKIVKEWLSEKNQSNNYGLFNNLMITKVLLEILGRFGQPANYLTMYVELIKILTSPIIIYHFNDQDNLSGSLKNEFSQTPGTAMITSKLILNLFDVKYINDYLMVNVYEGVKYFNRERFEDLMNWLFILCNLSNIKLLESGDIRKSESEFQNDLTVKGSSSSIKQKLKRRTLNILKESHRQISKIKSIAEKCGYKLDDFIQELKEKEKALHPSSLFTSEKKSTKKTAKNKKGNS